MRVMICDGVEVDRNPAQQTRIYGNCCSVTTALSRPKYDKFKSFHPHGSDLFIAINSRLHPQNFIQWAVTLSLRGSSGLRNACGSMWYFWTTVEQSRHIIGTEVQILSIFDVGESLKSMFWVEMYRIVGSTGQVSSGSIPLNN